MLIIIMTALRELLNIILRSTENNNSGVCNLIIPELSDSVSNNTDINNTDKNNIQHK